MLYSANIRRSFKRLRKRILNGKNLVIESGNARLVEDDAEMNATRYGPCYVLWKNNIAAVIWLEDLLVLHDCVTQLEGLDLHLLVRDPAEAVAALRSAGYEETPLDARYEMDRAYLERGTRMVANSASIGRGVVLLPARDWHYDLDESAYGFLPPVHEFLDSLMEVWLQMSSREYEDNLLFAMYVGRLIIYCYKLRDENNKPVSEPAYADMLHATHRELHYDIVSDDPKAESFTTTKRHQYHVRRSKDIKEGLFTPQPYQKCTYRPDLTTLTE